MKGIPTLVWMFTKESCKPIQVCIITCLYRPVNLIVPHWTLWFSCDLIHWHLITNILLPLLSSAVEQKFYNLHKINIFSSIIFIQICEEIISTFLQGLSTWIEHQNQLNRIIDSTSVPFYRKLDRIVKLYAKLTIDHEG